MSLRPCAADDCNETFEFDPLNPLKQFHSVQCQARMRMRRWRKSKRVGPGGGGGKRRQLALFSKPSVSAKRVKQPRPETAPLFTMFANGRHEKHVPIPPAEIAVLPVIGRCDSPKPPASVAAPEIAEAA